MNKVWIYTDTSKPVGDRDHLRLFATEDEAILWFEQHDREGVAFAYDLPPAIVAQRGLMPVYGSRPDEDQTPYGD